MSLALKRIYPSDFKLTLIVGGMGGVGVGGDKGRRIVPRHKFNLKLYCGEDERNPSILAV